MKHKFKPVGKAGIRDRVEKKFRARGALLFHGTLLLLVTVYLYAALPELLWHLYGLYYGDLVWIYGIFFVIPFFYHAIRYRYRHGVGYLSHETETEARISDALRASAPEDVEEKEALIRLQQSNKLKSRRLLLQHVALFLGFCGILLLRRSLEIQTFNWDALEYMAPFVNALGIWGIGLGAHLLRYVSAYGSFGEKREDKIDQMVERELRRDRRVRSAAVDSRVDEGGRISLADIERASQVTDSAAEKAP